MSFPGGSVVKNPPIKAGDSGLIPGSGRSPGEGNATHSNTLAWATVQVAAKESDTTLVTK